VLNAATARALATIAARADDILHAYDPGYRSQFGDAGVPERVFRAADPLSVVPPPDAYFLVADASGEQRYTRDGRLYLSEGRLRNAEGNVLGYTAGADGSIPETLSVDSVDAALERAIDLRVDPDGSIGYDRNVTDPRTMQRVTQRVSVGTIALARFPAGTNPLRATVAPHVGKPGSAGFGMLETRARSIGSLDVNLGLAKLQEAYLTFHALEAAQKARGELDVGAMGLVK
jgi:hypothetical protein